MTKPPLVPAILFLFVLALIPSQANAQYLAEMWQVTPKAGMEAGFQEAFKTHMEFREAQGDPWIWQTWQVVVGDDVGDFLIVSTGHEWADWDAYENSEFVTTAGPHFGATVAPMVEDATNLIFQMDTTMQKLPTDPEMEANLLQMMVFHVAPGKMMAFSEEMMKFHAAIVEADLPFYYLSTIPVIGGESDTFTIATFGPNWAHFADPDPSMMEVMVQKYGEEEAMGIWTRMGEVTVKFESAMLRYRPDLSNVPEM